MADIKNIAIPCVGYEIAADWYEGDTSTILLNLIGFTTSKAKYSTMLSYITSKTGIAALTIDYTGHGESPFELDELTPAQNFSEVVTAYDWLKGKYPEAKIIVMGTSYGGFHAANLANYREIDELILRVSAMYEPYDMYTKWKYADREKRHDYRLNSKNLDANPCLSHYKGVKGKTFVITHELDDVCPPNSTKPFIDAFNAEHWEAPGFKHGLSKGDVTEEQETEYYQKIVDWIQK